MNQLIADIRYASRMLFKNPAFTSVAIITLAIGIGANTAIFSAVNALLLSHLPVPEAERVVFGVALREGFDPFATSLLEYEAYRDRSQSFTTSGLAIQHSFNLIGQGEARRLQGARVMSGYMDALNVTPVTGRSFTPDDDRPGGPSVAIIGYRFWQQQFAGDRSTIGRTITLEERVFTIVGVMPAGFDLPFEADLWVPLQVDPALATQPERLAHAYQMVARLKPGVTLATVDAEVKDIARSLEVEHPQTSAGWGYRLVSLRDQLLGDLAGRTRQAIYALVASVGFLLLICCANVANLLLVRGVARERENGHKVGSGSQSWPRHSPTAY